ncbi:hypothetical protein FACS1894205_1040 [Alphaproteobacteria bacterium]|nr:hypothetical protein FACS1894205_1040 [Alphaproteobacteria bacterium]
MLAFFRVSVLAFALVLPGFFLVASAQDVSPRGSDHEKFGRMVFDWEGPVAYSADIVNNQLIVRFNREAPGDPEPMVKALPRWVRSVSVSLDRKTFIFPLVRPVAINAFINGVGSVVIDILIDPTQPADAVFPPPGAAQPQPPPQPSEPQSQPPPPPQAKPGDPAPAAVRDAVGVTVRTGEHGGYFRTTYDWPKTVAYSVDRNGGQFTLTFQAPGKIDDAQLRSRLSSDIKLVESTITPDGKTRLTFNLPNQANVRHFSSGPKIVVDIVREGAAKLPDDAKATMLGKDDADLPTIKPLTTGETDAKPPASLPPPPTGDAPTTPETPPETTPAALPPPVAGSTSRTPLTTTEETAERYSLVFPQTAAIKAALFNRAGYLWLVLEQYAPVNIDAVKKAGGEALLFVERRDSRGATILRMIVQPGFNPSLRKDSQDWVVDLARTPWLPDSPIPVEQPVTLGDGVGVSFMVADASNPIRTPDPEVGDVMLVIAVNKAGVGLYPGRDVPDMEMLPTFQGIALVPRIDGLDIKVGRASVTVSSASKGGLKLTPVDQAPVTRDADPLFDFPGWAKGGFENFSEECKQINQRLAGATPASLGQVYFDAAKFFLANGFAAEALGYANIAATEAPSLVDTGAFRAVRGAANVLMRRWDAAIFDLDSPLAKNDPEAQFWSAVAHAERNPDDPENGARLVKGLPYVAKYTPLLQWPLLKVVTRGALDSKDELGAERALDSLSALVKTPQQKAWSEYYKGRLSELKGSNDTALGHYAEAQKTGNREARARAGLAETELRLKRSLIDASQAVDKLNSLRFAWREEDFEFPFLKRLSELLIQAGEYPEALRAKRALTNYYPANPGTKDVLERMKEVFAKLYLEGVGDTMAPVTAIALYDEFRDLTPSGQKGDEMIRKLADRLVSVDLLDRAALLLKYQMDYRLRGLEKTRIGAQIAVLQILDHRPSEALQALDQSEMSNIPPELALQRRTLRAHALSDMGKSKDAIALLKDDYTTEAALLRAEIYWNNKDWKNAALTFSALISRPKAEEELDDASARLVMSWASALILSNDEPALAALGRNFSQAMEKTPYKDGFHFLTSALDYGLPDMPALARNINDAEGFKTFLSRYKEQLQKGGVSAIN